MATILAQVPLTATADVLLVASAQGRGPAGWRLGFLGASWVGSVVLKANMAAPGQAQSLTSIAFITESTGATNAADTPITATGAFIVQPDNCAYDLYAVYTHTSGSAVVTVQAQDGATASGDLTAANLDGSGSQNTFGGNVPYTGSYTFPGALAITGALTGVTQATFSTKLVSITALATPSALAATALNAFASTVSGAVLMGYGTTADVTLKNRAGTDVLLIGPNTTAVKAVGDFTVGASTFVVTAATGAVASSGVYTLDRASAAVGTSIQDAGTGYVIIANTTDRGGAAGSVTGINFRSKFNTTMQYGFIQSEAYGTGSGNSRIMIGGFNGATYVTGLTVDNVAGAVTCASSLAITGALTGVTTAAISATASIYGATAAPATAGAAAAGAPIKLYSGLLTIEATTDAPTHTRPKGSLCINTGGSSTTTRLYVNTDGAGTWTPFTTSA